MKVIKYPAIGLLEAEKLAKLFSVIYLQSCSARGDPSGWKLANMVSIDKNDRKEDPENYRLSSLTSVTGKEMEQIILHFIIQHDHGIRLRQHVFMKGRFCLTNLISFCDKITCLLEHGKAVDVSARLSLNF